jgi:hypothetical protein
VDTFLTKLKADRAGSAVNRYRTALSRLFSRAVRVDKIITANPVRDVRRNPEPAGRMMYFSHDGEKAMLAALSPCTRASGGAGR